MRIETTTTFVGKPHGKFIDFNYLLTFMLGLLLSLKQIITIQQQDLKKFLLQNIHICASQAPYGKLRAPENYM